MDETEQINVCIDEMAKLKEKMETLEKQKILNEQHEMLRKTTMEPNLKVLENWLQDYRQAVEHENKSATSKMIDEKKNYIRKEITEMIQYKNNRRMRERRNNQNVDFDEIEKMLESLDYDSYQTLSKKESLVTTASSGNNYGYFKNYGKISFITFEQKPQPSEVMEAHIEATYNMFNIINKRLDDIERKIEINK